MRTVALRWNLPEHLVTGSAANNNFASSLVAETPFVKYAETQQQYYARRDKRTLERVLWFAWTAGRFGDVPWRLVQRSVDITITPPQVEVRDPEKETRVRKMLHDAGVLSRQTWSAQEGLDFAQEQKNLNREAAEMPAADSPETNHQRSVESLEADWDPSKHPRGGNPKNSGEFSETSGGGTSGVFRSAEMQELRSVRANSWASYQLTRGPAPRSVSPPVSELPAAHTSAGKPGVSAKFPGKVTSPAAAASAMLPAMAAGSVLDQGVPRQQLSNQQKLDFLIGVIAARLRNSGLSDAELREYSARITDIINAKLEAAGKRNEPIPIPKDPKDAARMADELIDQAKREAAADKARIKNNLPKEDGLAAPVPSAAGGGNSKPPDAPVAQGPSPRPDNEGDDDFWVGRHADMPSPRPGQNSHHGVLSAWAQKNLPGYNQGNAPAVLMPTANHRATFGVFNKWISEMREKMGGVFDWKRVSEAEMRQLSEKMFDAAKVPSTIRKQYWEAFDRMKLDLSKP